MNMIEALIMTIIGIIAIERSFPFSMYEGITWAIVAMYISVIGSFLTKAGLPYHAWTGEK